MNDPGPPPTRYGTHVAFLTVLALALRLWGLGSKSFWIDEIFTFETVAPDWGGILQRAAFYNDAPLYFWIIRPFHLLVGGELGLRLPSALLGAATVPFVYLAGKRMFAPDVARFAAGLLALSPFHLWFSQEARPYALLIFLWTAATWVFLLLLEKESRGRWLLYGALLTLCLYAKVLSAFLFAFHFAVWLVLRKRAGFAAWKPFAAWILPVVLLAPIVPTLAEGLQTAGGSARAVSVLEVPYTLYALAAGYSLGPSPTVLHRFTFADAVQPYVWHFIVATLAFLPAALVGLGALWQKRHARWVVLLWLFVPVILMNLLSAAVGKHGYNVRYVSPAVVPALMVLALGAAAFGRAARSGLLSLCLLGGMLFADYNHLFVEEYSKWDIRSASAWLEEHGGPRDTVFVVDHPKVFEHYYSGPMAWAGIDVAIPKDDPAEYRRRVEAQIDELASRTGGRLWLLIGRWQQLDPDQVSLEHGRASFGPGLAETRDGGVEDTYGPVHFDLVDLYCFAPP